MASQDGSTSIAVERKPLVSPPPARYDEAEDGGHPFDSEPSWANSDLIRTTKKWASTWQLRDLAMGIPIIVGLLVVAFVVFAASRMFELDMGPSESRSMQFLQEDLRQAEAQFEENIRQREWALTASINEWRESHPAGYVKEVWFCPPYPCPNLARMGVWGEGGKWVCLTQHEVNPTPAVISVGSQGDASFEQEMARRLHAFSNTFDATLPADVQKTMHGKTFLKFHNLGLSAKSEMNKVKKEYPDSTFLSIDELLAKVNLKRADVLKLDCEGCEYGVVKDMTELYTSSTVPFGQILVEVHGVIDKWSTAGLDLVKDLERLGFRMYFSEVNAYFPECYELSFIHESLVKPL